MTDSTETSTQLHNRFLGSPRKHVLMITNHGVHEWQVVPGLPDTGGQNVFVNHFTAELAQMGWRITVVNRGGYPHPITGQMHKGLLYKDENQRILYLDDGVHEFIRKEDMGERVQQLAGFLGQFLDLEGTPVDLILSHYWDGARVGALYNRARPERCKHIWVPHSLGALKKRNVSPSQWTNLRMDERQTTERNLIAELDGVAATSSAIENSLIKDYGYTGPILFLPPCVDTDRYHPREIADGDPVWAFLGRCSGLCPEQVRASRIVTEISRTDSTKRKDVLIKAFGRVQNRLPDSLLVVSIDDGNKSLASELKALIDQLGLQNRVAVVGSVWNLLPVLYAVTDVYCTPSVMEGFGMSAQEAAATGVPVVASHLVPFATEYLLGVEVDLIPGNGQPVKKGQGAVIVQADDVSGFAHALEMLLTDNGLRKTMGQNAYHTTVSYFTWRSRVQAFLDAIDVHP
jgi:mannosylfructose-phosphate synthase